MHQIFTKYLRLLVFVAAACLAGNGAAAQYTTTTLETGKYYTALAVDKNDDLYVVRNNGTSYEVAKYTKGRGVPVVIYTGLAGAPGAYSWGIAVNDAGVVFVTNPNPATNWEIIRLTPGSGGTYTPQIVQSGNWYSALTVMPIPSPDNGLLAIERPNATTYRLKLFAEGQEDQTGTHLILPINPVAGAQTFPWGVAMDAAANFYVLDLHENNNGQVIRMNSASGYTSHDIVASGRFYSALAIDKHNNIYTTERFGSDYQVVKRSTLPSSSGQTLLSGLNTHAGDVPWGLAVNSKGEVFVGDGSSPTGGRLLRLSPPAYPVLSAQRVGASPTAAASVQYSVSFGWNVTNVTPAAFSLQTTGTITGASVTSVTAVNGSNYTVTVNTGTGSGQLTLVVTDNGLGELLSNVPFTDETYTIDKTPPAVTAVGVPDNGYYKAGDPLNFTVQYDEITVVNTDAGIPYLDLVIGSTNVRAGYASGSGSAQHTFSYTVQPGENDLDGIALGSSIVLNGGTIQDATGNSLQLALQNVATTKGVYVNTVSPSVTLSTTASSPVSGAFPVTITFSEAVTGLVLEDFVATNAVLSFLATADNITYTLTATPQSNGTMTVSLPAGQAVNIGNNSNLASNTLSLNVDKSSPTVNSVLVPSDDIYTAGQSLTFSVLFNENIVVAGGTPTLPLTIGSTTVQVPFSNGPGNNIINFVYTVQSGDLDTDGIVPGTQINLGGATIRDAAGNNASLTLAGVPSTDNVKIDAVVPVVTSVEAPSDGHYRESGILSFKVNFSEPVNVTGAPTIPLTIGSTVRQLTYTGGTGTDMLTFEYTVQNGDHDMDGVAIGNTIALNGGSVRDIPGNYASVVLNNISSTSNVFVNTTAPTVVLSGTPSVNSPFTLTATFSEAVTGLALTEFDVTNAVLSNLQTNNNITYTVLVTPSADGPVSISVPANAAVNIGQNGNSASNTISYNYDGSAPAVTATDVPQDGYYKAAQHLDFTVHFNEIVTVTGTPQIPITIGSTNVNASYTGGSGSNALSFRYTVQNGDMDMDGIDVSTFFNLNGGTIKDASGNSTLLALNNIGSTSGVFVNTATPTVALSGTPSTNAPFTLTATFSEAVTGLALTEFDVTNAALSNLQTNNNITYTVLVTPSADGPVSISVPANVAVNVGHNGNSASNTISYNYDGSAPAVTATDVPQDGYYKAAQHLDFTVHFNEIVTVTGTPQFPITIGSTNVNASYTGGSGSNAVSFRYTVQNGEMDMDGIAVGSSLLLNGGTIKDASGNNALLALNNIESTSDVFVNTAAPAATLSIPNTGRVNQPMNATLTFSEAVTGLSASSFQVTNGAASGLRSVDNITYTVLITPAADGTVSISLPAGVAQNIAGNGNLASNTVTFTFDATAPVITAGQTFSTDKYSPNGTILGQVRADAGTDPLQNWAIAADGSGGALEITANGTIRVKNATQLATLGGTTVTLQLTVSDGLNTSAPTPVTIAVTFVNQAPTLAPISNVSHCSDAATHTLQLTGASATEPDQTFSITATASPAIFDLLTVNTSNVLSYRLKPGTPTGNALVTVRIKDNGGTQNGGTDTLLRTFTVTITAPAAVTITSNKGASVSKGETVRLTATGGSTYSWTDAPGIIGSRQNAVLEIRPQANMTYEVTATNANGCTGTATFSIAVVNDFKVDATNVLTPNGDGRNDRWIVRNLDSYPDNEVKIFDRTGRIVYQKRNYSNDWNGTVNGNPLAEGTYYYILTINNGQATAKGYITIVRDSK